MPKRDWTLSVKDISTGATKILEYSQGMDREAFFKDSKTYDAVLRNLEIIGEATKNVPDEVREKYADVEWKKFAGLRDIAIHKYFGINEDILWDVITNKIPELKAKIAEVLDKINTESEN